MKATKGFITIATGNIHYYKIAYNLLLSYKQFASEKFPFAILCDRRNKFSEKFDYVIIMDEPTNSYLDKLALEEYLPFEENIFIDADCLAYGDLNRWWNDFSVADDFSCIGYAWNDLKCGKGWFDPEGLKEYKGKISFIPSFNGGMYYLRKTKKCKQIFKLAKYFASHYYDYSFKGFSKPADEPCLALAMAVYNCKPIDLKEGGLVFAPGKKNTKLDIKKPYAFYQRTPTDAYKVILVHWSNYRTTLSKYKYEVGCLYNMANNTNNSLLYLILYKKKIVYLFLKPQDMVSFCKRVDRKIKSILKSTFDKEKK